MIVVTSQIHKSKRQAFFVWINFYHVLCSYIDCFVISDFDVWRTKICSFLSIHRSKDKEKYHYRLLGIVEHLGSMRGGHYVSYVRAGDKSRGKTEKENGGSIWYHANDAYVHEVSQDEVLHCEAYILFYEKIWDRSTFHTNYVSQIQFGVSLSTPNVERDREEVREQVSVQHQLPFIS